MAVSNPLQADPALDSAPAPDGAVHRAVAPRHGRGAVANVRHRFDTDSRQEVDDGWSACVPGDAGDAPQDAPPSVRTTVAVEQAGKIMSRNQSPDIPFDRAINPYRGCEHGCVYCFARPTHAYLGWSPGLDFETRLVAKTNAVEALRDELSRPGYRVDVVNIGSATDAYQPVERQWRLTRGLLELLLETRHPVSLATKGSLVTRDVDLLAQLAERRLAAVYVTVTTLDADMARALEPRAAAPWRRLEAIRTLAQASIPVGVSLAPVIPFINDDQLEHIVEAVRDAGAVSVFYSVLRLPHELKEVFAQWLEAHYPDRKSRVLNRMADLRGGKIYDAQWGVRMSGEGVWAQLLNQRFRRAARKHGLFDQRIELDTSQFVPPARRPRQRPGTGQAPQAPQLDLF